MDDGREIAVIHSDLRLVLPSRSTFRWARQKLWNQCR
jgi:hypothetical protein